MSQDYSHLRTLLEQEWKRSQDLSEEVDKFSMLLDQQVSERSARLMMSGGSVMSRGSLSGSLAGSLIGEGRKSSSFLGDVHRFSFSKADEFKRR